MQGIKDAHWIISVEARKKLSWHVGDKDFPNKNKQIEWELKRTQGRIWKVINSDFSKRRIDLSAFKWNKKVGKGYQIKN